jgi:hypothetical protein
VTLLSCHPGDVNSKLSNDLGFGGSESPDQGADTPAWLATAPEGEIRAGGFYELRGEKRCLFARDKAACVRLAELCRGYLEP